VDLHESHAVLEGAARAGEPSSRLDGAELPQTFREFDPDKVAAAVKGIVANNLQAGGEKDARQLPAVLESSGADAHEAFGKPYGSDRGIAEGEVSDPSDRQAFDILGQVYFEGRGKRLRDPYG
jgi:hypothetical protein